MKVKLLFKSMMGCLGAWALIQAAPGLTYAADAQGVSKPEVSSQDELGSIIVTARRVEERLQDVPISISVLNEQQIDNRNIVNANDLATYVPSLTAMNNFGPANSTFGLRGFVQEIGTQPAVGVFFADVVAPRGLSNNLPIGDGAGPGTFWDLQNVQVLKGPQGTLFGRNTTGGDILIVPQKPTSKQEGYAEITFGNYGEKRIQAVENLPINDNIRFRIGVDHQNRDGYENNDTGIYPARFGDIDYTDVRASLVVDVTPDIENYTIASYLVSDTHGDVQKLVACNPALSPANFLGLLGCAQLAQEQAKGASFYTVQSQLANSDTRLETWQVINTTTWHASDNLTVKNIASYAQLDEKYVNPIFGTNWFLAPGVPVVFAESTPLAGGSTADESTTTEEIQLQGTGFNNALTWQAGAYAEDVEPLAKVGSQSPVLLDCINPDNFNCLNPLGIGDINYTASRSYENDFGLYEQASYAATETLKFTEGFRWTWDRQHSLNNLISYAIPTPESPVPFCTQVEFTPPDCAANYRTQSNAPTWLLGVDYKPIDDVLVYGKWSRGYRAGGIEPSVPVEFAIYQPERVDTYESGFKTSFNAPIQGTFNGAVFYNNFSNQQLQLGFDAKPGAGVGPSSGIQNAGKSRIWGAELDMSLIPFKGFQWDTGYTYLNAKIKSIDLAETPASSPYVVEATAHAGDTLILTPRSKVSTTGTYTLPIADTVGRVYVSATFTHSNKQLVDYADRESPLPQVAAFSVLPALNLVNMDAGWKNIYGSHLDVSAFVSNLTNKDYYTFVAGLYSAQLGLETAELGQPRFYGMRVRYKLVTARSDTRGRFARLRSVRATARWPGIAGTTAARDRASETRRR